MYEGLHVPLGYTFNPALKVNFNPFETSLIKNPSLLLKKREMRIYETLLGAEPILTTSVKRGLSVANSQATSQEILTFCRTQGFIALFTSAMH
jgi:hypothetical protein